MIFWMGGEKYSHFLIQISYAENISTKVSAKKVGLSLGAFAKHVDGFRFTKHTCSDKDGKIDIFLIKVKTRKNEFKLVDSLKIYTDKDNIDEMPDHVLIKTDSVDFIRKLFQMGKRVSWYDPDLDRFSKYLPLFDFEHLFVDIFRKRNRVLIHPNGKVLPITDEFGNHNFDFDNGIRKKYKSIPWAVKIGYHRKALDERVNKVKMHRREHRRYFQGLPRHFIPRLGGHYLLWYFNMLSISYMLCKRSIAANVKTRSALNE